MPRRLCAASVTSHPQSAPAARPRHGHEVPIRRNAETRSREYLTEAEVERLIEAARKGNRWGHRDSTMLLVAFSHGLRAAELVSLRWDAVDLDHGGRIHINRVKGSRSGVHRLRGAELRALRRLKREAPPASFVFTSERGAPFTTAGFRKMVARLGVAAGFDFPVHPHMLRHATGYKFANEGRPTRDLQEFMGHASITSTVRYAALSPARFKDFWKD